jgi:hypothetical protein
MLHVIPDNLEQVAISMETLLDLESLSVDEADGHLRTMEQRKYPPPAKENSDRQILTEEWMTCMKNCCGSNSNTGARHDAGGKNSDKSK